MPRCGIVPYTSVFSGRCNRLISRERSMNMFVAVEAASENSPAGTDALPLRHLTNNVPVRVFAINITSGTQERRIPDRTQSPSHSNININIFRALRAAPLAFHTWNCDLIYNRRGNWSFKCVHNRRSHRDIHRAHFTSDFPNELKLKCTISSKTSKIQKTVSNY